MKQILRLAIFLAIFNIPAIPEPKAEAYIWKRVAIGGGGYVTGFAMHPTEPDLIYFRTDNGGVYKWNPPTASWHWITKEWTVENKNYYGVDGIGLDPSNPEVLYITAGKDIDASGAIFKSINRGKSWIKLKDIAFAGNGALRWAGEPIAVDPSSSDVVYVGTRNDGLLRTDDGGLTWTTVAAVPRGEAGIGIRTVAIAPFRPGRKRAAHIYASVYGTGIFIKTDDNPNWILLSGSPKQPRRMKISKTGKVYATDQHGVFSYDGTQWEEISPSRDAFGALDVSTENPDKIIVAADFYGSKNLNPMKVPIYLSSDGGRSWTEIVSKSKWTFVAPWYPATRFSAATADLNFDPRHPKRVWLADWYQVMVTDDIDASSVSWNQRLYGHEQASTLSLSAPPIGAPLISGLADIRGFRHISLNKYPGTRLNVPMETTGIDFCESDPNALFAVGGDRRGGAAYSVDNGASWVMTSWPFGGNGKVAVSATDPNLIVVVPRNSSPKRSVNRGSTWEETSGAPAGGVTDFWSGQIPVAADRIAGDVFYYLNADGDFFRSVDGGANWSKVSHIAVQSGYTVKAAPGINGMVWVSAAADGMYRSRDGGSTFERLENVDQALLFGFGKQKGGDGKIAVFVYGRVAGIAGIYRSDDLGGTWESVSDDSSIIGINPKVMEGDRQIAGRVYIGTGGGGVFYGVPK